MNQDLAEVPSQRDHAIAGRRRRRSWRRANLRSGWTNARFLLDIDGTLLDLAPTPREVWVPPGLATTLNRLHEKTSGALALVSGRSLNDIDLIFAPEQFPAVGGHGAEMRISGPIAKPSPPMRRRWTRN